MVITRFIPGLFFGLLFSGILVFDWRLRLTGRSKRSVVFFLTGIRYGVLAAASFLAVKLYTHSGVVVFFCGFILGYFSILFLSIGIGEEGTHARGKK